MARARSKDPVAAAITSYLWAEIKAQGFTKVTAKSFSKEENGMLYRFQIDANGVNGNKSVYLLYGIDSIYQPSINGYLLGGRFKDRVMNMSDHEKADSAMLSIIADVQDELYPMFEEINSTESLLKHLDQNSYHPLEGTVLSKALCYLASSRTNEAAELLASLLEARNEYYVDIANEIMGAMAADTYQKLMKKWAEENRKAYKL